MKGMKVFLEDLHAHHVTTWFALMLKKPISH